MNYYNEFDPHAAAWLRQLIAEGLIPPGEVDTRSITDVQPNELTRFTQCHFFAGIGGWSLALQLAGWPADKPVWSGSCPCQPFSVAGKGKGSDDERHLWPAFFNLIRECRPDVVFGEQVESAIGHGWLDGIRADLEGEGYACGDCTLGAHSAGADHQRQRLYWVAHSRSVGIRGGPGQIRTEVSRSQGEVSGKGYGQESGADRAPIGLAHSLRPGLEGHGGHGDHGDEPGRVGAQPPGPTTAGGTACGRMGQPDRTGREPGQSAAEAAGHGCATEPASLSGPGLGDPEGRGCGIIGHEAQPGRGGYPDGASLNPWSDTIWIPCRDGKHRRIPTEPALFPLADGLPYKLARRGSIRPALLKGAGNAIVPQVAAMFIEAFDGAELL